MAQRHDPPTNAKHTHADPSLGASASAYANPSLGMSASISAHSRNLLACLEPGLQFQADINKLILPGNHMELQYLQIYRFI